MRFNAFQRDLNAFEGSKGQNSFDQQRYLIVRFGWTNLHQTTFGSFGSRFFVRL